MAQTPAQSSQQTFTGRKRIRKFFGHIREVAEMPNLIEVQKASYDQFLMVDEPKGGRLDEGLQSVFKSVFPITDFSGQAMLEFVRYEFEQPKFDVDECQQRIGRHTSHRRVDLPRTIAGSDGLVMATGDGEGQRGVPQCDRVDGVRLHCAQGGFHRVVYASGGEQKARSIQLPRQTTRIEPYRALRGAAIPERVRVKGWIEAALHICENRSAA